MRSQRGETPLMQAAGGGRVIYLTSTAGVVKPIPGLHLSNVMRAGVAALAKSLVGEYGPEGITFNVVAPGPIDTDLTATMDAADRQAFIDALPVGRFGRPEEIADAVLWLCSSAASYVTGQSISVDGGFVMR